MYGDDLSDLNLVAAPSWSADQIPPTVKDFGWKLKLIEAKRETGQGGDASIRFSARIESEGGRWNGHVGEFMFFLGGKWPESAAKKFNSFAAAVGIAGAIKSTDDFKGKTVIAEFKLSNDGKYSNISRWWEDNSENKNRIAVQPLPVWTEAPNIPDDGVPF